MGDINNKKRILWHSNAGNVPSGYGNQTGLFTPLIKQSDEWDVIVSAFCGIELSWRKNAHGILELPRHVDGYGNDVVEAHYGAHDCKAVVSLLDPFVLDPEVWGGLNCAMWSPIDCYPVSPENWRVMRHAKRVWSMSRFGHEQILAMGYPAERLDYVPHGVNTDVFRPIDKQSARAFLERVTGRDDLADKFIVMSNSANKGRPSRKNFVGMLRAFKKFAENKPDAIFFLHTEMKGIKWGDNIHELVEQMGLEGRVIHTSPYDYGMNFVDGEALNQLYNACDVYFSLSFGEGFGIPLIEAQAAGLPVVVTDGSAMTELGKVGYLVKSSPIPPSDGRLGCWWALADEDDAVFGLTKMYAYHRAGNTYLNEEARRFALEYDYRRVWEQYMKPALLKLTETKDILSGDLEVNHA